MDVATIMLLIVVNFFPFAILSGLGLGITRFSTKWHWLIMVFGIALNMLWLGKEEAVFVTDTLATPLLVWTVLFVSAWLIGRAIRIAVEKVYTIAFRPNK